MKNQLIRSNERPAIQNEDHSTIQMKTIQMKTIQIPERLVLSEARFKSDEKTSPIL